MGDSNFVSVCHNSSNFNTPLLTLLINAPTGTPSYGQMELSSICQQLQYDCTTFGASASTGTYLLPASTKKREFVDPSGMVVRTRNSFPKVL